MTKVMMGYQPTYEELKRANHPPDGVVAAGYQPTYEELKQWATSEVDELASVTSLPMRN